MTTDLLLNVPESSGPDLEIARRELARIEDQMAEDGYLSAEAFQQMSTELAWAEAKAKVAQLEAAEMQRRAGL